MSDLEAVGLEGLLAAFCVQAREGDDERTKDTRAKCHKQLDALLDALARTVLEGDGVHQETSVVCTGETVVAVRRGPNGKEEINGHA